MHVFVESCQQIKTNTSVESLNHGKVIQSSAVYVKWSWPSCLTCHLWCACNPRNPIGAAHLLQSPHSCWTVAALLFLDSALPLGEAVVLKAGDCLWMELCSCPWWERIREADPKGQQPLYCEVWLWSLALSLLGRGSGKCFALATRGCWVSRFNFLGEEIWLASLGLDSTPAPRGSGMRKQGYWGPRLVSRGQFTLSRT